MKSASLLESRFIHASDPSLHEFVFQLPDTWWSRPYEYAWCASFIDSNDIALDAACGIPHPFKFVLGERCKMAYACDLDPRVNAASDILDSVRSDISEEAAAKVSFSQSSHLQLCQASLTELPYADDFFDKIFCISVVEHLNSTDMLLALKEFNRTLKDDGLLLLTLDYPTIQLEMFHQLVLEAGLSFYSAPSFDLPSNALHTDLWGGLYCFRAVLRKKIHK
ncbi:class I SAM-dependent methyltransferase [Paenibacillus alba]|uniref:Class I SAM-dependent methyltransferase n=1 Tax=Paenibacillus alba TaxID=1197127 RepID=A0ABU6FZ99_9BACL|nr:class I SAM-dependent methyltransferase [Paenibacillus alba]MEC0227225.1 class I SAM-dependent methyltransferase [Paenibacillus alba]